MDGEGGKRRVEEERRRRGDEPGSSLPLRAVPEAREEKSRRGERRRTRVKPPASGCARSERGEE
jgi:hypothetical protein